MGLQVPHCSAKTSYTRSLNQCFPAFDLSCTSKLSPRPFATRKKQLINTHWVTEQRVPLPPWYTIMTRRPRPVGNRGRRSQQRWLCSQYLHLAQKHVCSKKKVGNHRTKDICPTEAVLLKLLLGREFKEEWGGGQGGVIPMVIYPSQLWTSIFYASTIVGY